MAKHAFLSASASHRWINCPPSAKLCEGIKDESSHYAQEGTDCHELCAYLVEMALGRDVEDPTENLTYYSGEMQTVRKNTEIMFWSNSNVPRSSAVTLWYSLSRDWTSLDGLRTDSELATASSLQMKFSTLLITSMVLESLWNPKVTVR